ncbi:MAG: type II/IV secretion system protein [Candidatus Magasanikbacteria bacterium]|nr:type II/IV secretion system protein [Candidatus Magasanikbacteria bacterium]
MLPSAIFQQLITKEYPEIDKNLKDYEAKAAKKALTIEQFLISEGIVDETALYTAAAKLYDVPYTSIKGREIKKEILNLIPAVLAQNHNLIAFEKQDDTVSLAMLDPEDIETIEFVHRKTGLSPIVSLTSPSEIREAMRRYHADIAEDVIAQTNPDKLDSNDLKKAAQELPIVNIVNSILEHAVYEGASDIHIEPTEKEVTVRYRVDGLLKNVMSLPKAVQSGIMARIKILSNLKIDEHMIPQDGRFKTQVQDETLSFRVSIIPVYDGEKIVMRLLHESQKPLTLDQLGFLPGPKEAVANAIDKPHGMILVTGPTGSGKTTTLYSLLGMLNQPDVNISTIEDPIEYHVAGINQSQINPRVGFTFAAGLRAFLRQDPDIIMVGEIRDQETAEIAVHAALTGHLVLSTLHTNDAPTTLPRLLDMGIPPFLVAFTTNVIVAQRLVRKICEHCKKSFTLEKKAADELEKLLDFKKLTALLKSQGIEVDSEEKSIETIKFWRGEGCPRCKDSGYKGRIGIYEVLEMDKELADKISARAGADDIRKFASEKNMITMLQDGLIKAKQGITTIEEVLRATRD